MEWSRRCVAGGGASAHVRATNDSSSVSKRSAVELGYWEDRFWSRLAVQQRRSPLINRGYWIRAAAVDYAVGAFLDAFGTKPCQILSLGAGFDSTFFRLAEKGHLLNCCYFEIDFPETLERKCAMIANDSELTKCTRLAKLALVHADLRDIPAVEAALASTTPAFDPALPTLALSEVAMAYLDYQDADRVLEWIATLPQALAVLYEQVGPEDAFGRIMMSHFNNRNSPLLTIPAYHSVASQVKRVRGLGLCDVLAEDMLTFLFSNRVPAAELERVLKLEPFDEFEEWHVKCAHYVMMIASSRPLPPITKLLEPKSGIITSGVSRSLRIDGPTLPACLRRFGLASCQLAAAPGRSTVLAFGGVGADAAGRHGRLNSAVLVDILVDGPNFRLCPIMDVANVHAGAAYASCTALPGGRALLLGGRQAPVERKQWEAMAATLLQFDLDSKKVSTVRMAVPAESTWPEARWRLASAVLQTQGDGDLVAVFGGRNAASCFDDFWLLDTASQTWCRAAPLPDEAWPPARHSHIMHAVDQTAFEEFRGAGCVVVHGGLDAMEAPLNDAWLGWLDQTGQTLVIRWRRIGCSIPPLHRYGHTSQLLADNRLVLIGGVVLKHRCKDPPIEVLHVATGLLQQCNLDLEHSSRAAEVDSSDEIRAAIHCRTAAKRPLLLHGCTSVLLSGSTVLAFGGGGNCFSFGTHLNERALVVQCP